MIYWGAGTLAVALIIAILYQVGVFNPPITTPTTPRKPEPREPTPSEPPPMPGNTQVRAKSGPTPSNKEAVPDWVPIYMFADRENIQLRGGAGSLSFETDSDATHVQADYAAKLQAAGWKVEKNYDFRARCHLVEGILPDQRRSLAASAWGEKSKTRVVVIFIDDSMTSSKDSLPPEGIPNWVPIYPGKVENIRDKGNVGSFTITITDDAACVSALYAAILRASGYEVTTDYDFAGGWNYARATAKSRGYSIVAASRGVKCW